MTRRVVFSLVFERLLRLGGAWRILRNRWCRGAAFRLRLRRFVNRWFRTRLWEMAGAHWDLMTHDQRNTSVPRKVVSKLASWCVPAEEDIAYLVRFYLHKARRFRSTTGRARFPRRLTSPPKWACDRHATIAVSSNVDHFPRSLSRVSNS